MADHSVSRRLPVWWEAAHKFLEMQKIDASRTSIGSEHIDGATQMSATDGTSGGEAQAGDVQGQIGFGRLVALMSSPDMPKSFGSPFLGAVVVPELGLEPMLVPSPARVQDADRCPAIPGFLNDLLRERAARQFWRRLHDGDPSPILITQGDSWLHYPVWRRDIADRLSGCCNVLPVGRTFERPEQLAPGLRDVIANLKRYGREPAAYVLSIGASTILSDAFAVAGFSDPVPASGFPLPNYQSLIERYIRGIRAVSPGLRIAIHGYGRFIPMDGWLSAAMIGAGLRESIARERFGIGVGDAVVTTLSRFGAPDGQGASPGVFVIDNRDLLTERRDWADEVHPSEEVCDLIADRMVEILRLNGGLE
ncbi:hypothetical protein [Hartmannibacter diazotrophicus]|nr:hypothetical protein [Hartmannibacter diazotrophicus]